LVLSAAIFVNTTNASYKASHRVLNLHMV